MEPSLLTAAALAVVAQAIRNRLGPPDISVLTVQIEAMPDTDILGVEVTAPDRVGEDRTGLADLSAIDFEKLAAAFAKAPRTAIDQMREKAEEKGAEMTARKTPMLTFIDLPPIAREALLEAA